MTAEIHDIADQRPHLMVVAGDGAHVIPRALIQTVIDGKKPSTIHHPHRAGSAAHH